MNMKHFCHKCLFGFGTARMRGFWEMSNADVLVNVNLCLCFVFQRVCVDVCVCVCVGVCVSCMTCSVRVCACVCVCTVLRDAAGSCAWSGDVMMSCGFLVSLLSLFSAWSTCWQPFEMSIIFITTKTSKNRWLSVKENLPKEQCGMLNSIFALFSCFFSFFPLCFLDNAH